MIITLSLSQTKLVEQLKDYFPEYSQKYKFFKSSSYISSFLVIKLGYALNSRSYVLSKDFLKGRLAMFIKRLKDKGLLENERGNVYRIIKNED